MSEQGATPARVGVRELRQNLSVYLDRVKAGETLEVTEHGQPVARLGPRPPETMSQLERLIADGRVTPATGDLSALGPPLRAPEGAPSLSEILRPDARRRALVTERAAVYLDASAIVKLIVEEPGSAELLAHLGTRPLRVTSRIAEVEVRRAVARMDAVVDVVHDRVARVLATLTMMELGAALASQPGAFRPRHSGRSTPSTSRRPWSSPPTSRPS